MEKLPLRYIIPMILAMTAILSFFFGKEEAENAHGGSNVPMDVAAQRMPDGASDVQYYFSPTFTAFEFNTDEPTFTRWAAAWTPHEISSPVKIKRHNYMGDAAGPVDAPDEITVTAGLAAGHMRPDGTGEMTVFDRTLNRAYYLNIP
ncbi:MAG: hypothetical protein PHI85_06450 [Victivallaceae bacterium]|nr:hypothetical protein [Victivallaceae bacterium]